METSKNRLPGITAYTPQRPTMECTLHTRSDRTELMQAQSNIHKYKHWHPSKHDKDLHLHRE